jgi:hypothetical protein
MARETIADTSSLTINGIPCSLFVCISPAVREGEAHSLLASITLRDVDLILEVATQYDAMLIPDGSIQDELDKQVALASAEALLDVDNLKARAGDKLRRLESLYMDVFGLPERPIVGV